MSSFRRFFRPPGGDFTWLAGLTLLLPVVATVSNPEHWLNPLRGPVSASSLVAAVALWRRKRWGKWLAGTVLLLIAVHAALPLQNGFKTIPVVTSLGIAWCAWSAFRATLPQRDDDSDGKGLVAMVGLFRELPYLDTAIIARAASDAWGVEIDGSQSDDDAATDFVVGESPAFILSTGGRTFLINHFDQPYFDDVEKAAELTWEMRHQTAIREHKAWVSVDLLNTDNPREKTTPESPIYSLLSRLLAEFVDESCLAIFCPAASQMFVADADTEAHLRSKDPIAALNGATQAPMIAISDDDPRMQAAVAEARRRWPEFAEAFAGREDDSSFFVKYPMPAGDGVEFIWAEVQAIENERIYAVLANEPLNGPRKLGDRVQIPVGEVNDWNYVDPAGRMTGGFTIQVLTDAARQRDEEVSE